MRFLITLFGGWLFFCSLPGAHAQYQTLGQGIGEQGGIQQFALDSTNNFLFAQGTFSELGDGTVAHQLAYWDGTLWRPVPGISDTACQTPCGQFYKLHWRKDTLWYARITGSLDGDRFHIGWITEIGTNWSFSEDTNSSNEAVSAFFEFRDTLYVVGYFDTINSTPAMGIAKWKGGQWEGITSPFPEVIGFCLGAFEDNDALFIYGNFNFQGGLNEIMKWDGEQSLSAIGSDGFEGGFASVASMTRYQGEIYLGGSFYTADGNEANNICKLINNQFVPFGSGLNLNPDGSGTTGIGFLQEWNGYLVALGNFHYANGFHTPDLALWDGSRWCKPDSWHPTGSATGFWRMAQYNGDLVATIPNWHVHANGDTLKGPTFLSPGPPHACGPPLSVTEHDNETPLKVWPNPAQDHITLEVPFTGLLTVTDALGRMVYQQEVNAGMLRLDVQQWPLGWMHLQITGDTQQAATTLQRIQP